MGSAKDIVEHAGVPRFLFSDFPLGNSCGKPNDNKSQQQTLALALNLLESAIAPRTTVQSPLRWRNDADWKLDFQSVDRMPAAEIARRRSEFDEVQRVAKKQREEAVTSDPNTAE